MLIDTHAHLYLDRFDDDREQAIERACRAGVEFIVMPAIDLRSIDEALELAERYEGLYVMTALHPSETKDASLSDFDKVARFCGEEKVVAVGESGLDYYWDRSFDERQHEFLRLHVRLAMERGLPLVLHNREADEDLVRIIREEKAAGQSELTGIFHCFSGPAELASQAIELGFLLGIGGNLTFKNSNVPEAVADIDLRHMVLETDSPFLTPVPHRGKRNEPAFVEHVCRKLAELKTVSPEHVAAATTANARAVFAI